MNVLDEEIPGWDAVVEAGRVPGPDPILLERVRATLPIRRRRPRRTLALSGLAVAATVAATFAVPWLAGPGAADAAAADVLVRAADAVAAEPVARPGQFWQVRTETTQITYSYDQADRESVYLYAGDQTQWLPVGDANTTWTDSGSTVIRVLKGPLTLDQLRATLPPGRSTSRTEVTGRLPAGWQSPTDEWLAALPRDVERLRDKLYADTRGHGKSHDGEVLVYVADVLRSGRVPADLRAALYRVLSTVPGVRITATAVTVLGRPGIALGRLEQVDGIRQEIVIDQRTGQFVGERQTTPEGWVTEATVRRTLVDQVPATIRSRAEVTSCRVAADGAVNCPG